MASDYFMRQIQGITDVLSYAMFGKKSPDAEEKVYEIKISSGASLLLADLRLMLLQKRINEAENLLFEMMEDDAGVGYLDVAMRFYSWLDEMSAEELTACGYSREEINEGRSDAINFYNH